MLVPIMISINRPDEVTYVPEAIVTSLLVEAIVTSYVGGNCSFSRQRACMPYGTYEFLRLLAILHFYGTTYDAGCRDNAVMWG